MYLLVYFMKNFLRRLGYSSRGSSGERNSSHLPSPLLPISPINGKFKILGSIPPILAYVLHSPYSNVLYLERKYPQPLCFIKFIYLLMVLIHAGLHWFFRNYLNMQLMHSFLKENHTMIYHLMHLIMWCMHSFSVERVRMLSLLFDDYFSFKIPVQT